MQGGTHLRGRPDLLLEKPCVPGFLEPHLAPARGLDSAPREPLAAFFALALQREGRTKGVCLWECQNLVSVAP